VTNTIHELTRRGTSVWLDQLSRDLLETGELQQLGESGGVRGVTSNPTIAANAIRDSPLYRRDIELLAASGSDPHAILRELLVADTRAACDILRPVWDGTGGEDGYVSLEVDPHLIDDALATVAEARLLWRLVDRRNVMIKIPATEAALPAIEEALFDGLNVNVTLLFSVAIYEQVMAAYVRAMRRRLDAGKSLSPRSVASFFVSRVDTVVDSRLEELGRAELAGQAGVANARAAYQAFRRAFDSEAFADLRAAGCHVQRPLWASTGVKSPQYEPTKYVWELAGPDTVNTMPRATLEAVRSQPIPPADEGVFGSIDALVEVERAGVAMADVTDHLLSEGTRAFQSSMNELIAAVTTTATAA
jgi:transaldolase